MEIIYQLPLTSMQQYLLHATIGFIIFWIFIRDKQLRLQIPFIVGFLKEALDQYMYGGWNSWDLLATMIFPIFGTIYLRKPKKKEEELKPLNSDFRFESNVNYAVEDGPNIYGKYGTHKPVFRVDDYGVIRDWWFVAYMIYPTLNKAIKFSDETGAATIYRIRENKILKCIAQESDRGVGFINYIEKEVGEIQTLPGTKWKPLLISDYT